MMSSLNRKASKSILNTGILSHLKRGIRAFKNFRHDKRKSKNTPRRNAVSSHFRLKLKLRRRISKTPHVFARSFRSIAQYRIWERSHFKAKNANLS